jgi:hypothetical protein
LIHYFLNLEVEFLHVKFKIISWQGLPGSVTYLLPHSQEVKEVF